MSHSLQFIDGMYQYPSPKLPDVELTVFRCVFILDEGLRC
jgi:hypothetical protein